MDATQAAEFIRHNTVIEPPPLVPEIRLHTASEITPIWQATESALADAQVPPPFWAFPWAGGQALSRHILDHPELVRGRNVLDFGSGSGMVAIAALMAGAARVDAAEIDVIACTAIALNAQLNGVEIACINEDVIDRPLAGLVDGASVVLVGDMCYERPLAERLTAWLRREAALGAEVYMGDAGRSYLPRSGIAEMARYAVPTSLELEDNTVRMSIAWKLLL